MSESAAPCRGWCLFESPIGACAIAWGDSAVVGVQLPERDDGATRSIMRHRFPGAPEAAPPATIAAVIERVRATLNGVPDPLLDVPLDFSGLPEFHRRVWDLARAIPPGRTMTYGEMAMQLGDPGAARAVGQALGRNPFAPIVPCHRILAAHTGPGGFSAEGGAMTKLRLLEIERAQLGGHPGLFD